MLLRGWELLVYIITASIHLYQCKVKWHHKCLSILNFSPPWRACPVKIPRCYCLLILAEIYMSTDTGYTFLHGLGWDSFNHETVIRKKVSKWIWSHFCSLEIPFLWSYDIFTTLLQIIQIPRFLFPHLSNPISRCSYSEALCCLERGYILMMSWCHKGRHSGPLGVGDGVSSLESYFLIILNFLFHG